jgi:hypothetical protein
MIESGLMMRAAGVKTREHVRHLTRTHWVDQQIRAGRYPNTRKISEHFEVSGLDAKGQYACM